MALFDTSVLQNAVSVTAASSHDETAFMACTDLTGKSWKSFSLLIAVTNPTTPVATPGRRMAVHVGCTNVTLASNGTGSIADKARGCSRKFEYTLPGGADQVAYFNTPVMPLSGSYVSTWIEHEEWPAGATVTITAVQNE